MIEMYLKQKKTIARDYFGWRDKEMNNQIALYKKGQYASANNRAQNIANTKSLSPSKK